MAKDYNVLDELTPKTVELHRAIFDKGYEQGFKDGKEEAANCDCRDNMEAEYNRGLNAAWEAARRIVCPSDCCEDGLFAKTKEMCEGYLSRGIFKDYSATEAIEKIKAWEEKKKSDDMKKCKWFRVENANGSEGYRCDNPKNPYSWCHHVCEHFEGKTDEITVGDEVICYGTNVKKIVVHIEHSEDNTYYTCIGGLLTSTENNKNGKPIKTGKHYDNIDEIWEFLKGE